MKRTAVAFTLLSAVGGCVSTDGSVGGPAINGPDTVMAGPSTIPGAMGPGGVPVPVRAQMASGGAPSGEAAARAAFAKEVPPEIFQQVAATKSGSNSGIRLAGGPDVPPPGMIPPGAPGMGPPPGLMSPGAVIAPAGGFPNGAVAAVGALTGGYAGQFAAARTSVRFVEPRGLKISWMIPSADGRRMWNDKPLEAPASYNFTQAAIYRLKVSDIPDLPGVDLYPTLEVVPASQRAMTFLAHSSVPVSFTADDFRMVNASNYVVKVIYLPDPQFQDVAVGGGIGELISTQLDAGVDPVAEAAKRGSILLIVRLGNIDLELRHSPPMDAPPPGIKPGLPPGLPPGMPPGGMGMMPPGLMPPGLTGGPGRPMMGPGGPAMPVNPGAVPPRPTLATPLGQVPGDGSLPPLPPQTNPLTPAQLANQGTR